LLSGAKYLFWLLLLVNILIGCGVKEKAGEKEEGLQYLDLLSGAAFPTGWQALDTVKLYKGRELYQFINGGADLYLEYGFQEAATRAFGTGDQASVFVTLYRMADPEAAFGIFSVTRRPDHQPLALGSGCSQWLYVLIFYQGEVFEEIQALETSTEIKSVMEDLARSIEARLPAPGQSPQPELLNLLPEEALLPHSEVLVRGVLGLNSRRYLSDENLYALSDRTPGVLGSYQLQEDAQPVVLLVVNYPDNARAQSVYSALKTFYLQRASTRQGAGFRAGSEKLCYRDARGVDVISSQGSIVVSVFGAADESGASELIAEVLRRG